MWFWITMFVCNLLIPVIMIVGGYMMYKHTPKSINGIYGYRTKRSMKNMDTWKFAHDRCGHLWWKVGWFIFFPTIIVQMPFTRCSENMIGIVTLLIEGIQILALIIPVFCVEKELKELENLK